MRRGRRRGKNERERKKGVIDICTCLHTTNEEYFELKERGRGVEELITSDHNSLQTHATIARYTLVFQSYNVHSDQLTTSKP